MEQNVNPQIKNVDAFAENCQKIYSGIISLGVLCVLVVFPLYYKDYYFDILEAKYRFYYRTMLAMIVVVLLVSLAFLVVDFLEFKFQHTKAFLKRFSPKEIRNTMTAADWFLAAFLIAILISTFQSDFFYESFWGNEGRFTGLFLHLIYIVTFWMVAHLYRFKPWHGSFFLASAMLLLLFGITDYFKMDILGFKANISKDDIFDFTSTIGNINTYVTFVGIVFGCLSALFVTEKKIWKAVIYYLAYMITAIAMVMGNSDNAVFAIGVVFGFLPFCAFRNHRGIQRYLLLLAGFTLGAQVTGWVNETMAGQVLELRGFVAVIAKLKVLRIVAAGLFLGAVILYVAERWKKNKQGSNENGDLGTRYVKMWAVFLAACVIGLLFVLYDVNIGGNEARYGSLKTYLKFSDEWGTFRGMIWRISFQAFGEQPLSHKIWGHGLDTFGLMTRFYREETGRISGQVFDSAHNEYIQYFLTIGLVGFITYIGFLVSTLISILKKSRNKEWGLAIVFGAGCYLAQAIITINLPIVTPVLWMLLAVGIASCHPS